MATITNDNKHAPFSKGAQVSRNADQTKEDSNDDDMSLENKALSKLKVARDITKSAVEEVIQYFLGGEGRGLTISQWIRHKKENKLSKKEAEKLIVRRRVAIQDATPPAPDLIVDNSTSTKTLVEATKLAPPAPLVKMEHLEAANKIKVPAFTLAAKLTVPDTDAYERDGSLTFDQVDVALLPKHPELTFPHFHPSVEIFKGDQSIYRHLVFYESLLSQRADELKTEESIMHYNILKDFKIEVDGYLSTHYFGTKSVESMLQRIEETYKVYRGPGISPLNSLINNTSKFIAKSLRINKLPSIGSWFKMRQIPSTLALLYANDNEGHVMREALRLKGGNEFIPNDLDLTELLSVDDYSAAGVVWDSNKKRLGVNTAKHKDIFQHEMAMANQLIKEIKEVDFKSSNASKAFYERWGFVRLAKMVPKSEVYATHKVNRCIFATTFFSQIPMLMLLRALYSKHVMHVFPKSIKDMRGSPVMAKFSVFGGGMKRFVDGITSFAGLHLDKDVAATCAIYSDNFYLVIDSVKRSTGRVLTYLSLDASKMEGSQDKGTILFFTLKLLTSMGFQMTAITEKMISDNLKGVKVNYSDVGSSRMGISNYWVDKREELMRKSGRGPKKQSRRSRMSKHGAFESRILEEAKFDQSSDEENDDEEKDLEAELQQLKVNEMAEFERLKAKYEKDLREFMDKNWDRLPVFVETYKPEFRFEFKYNDLPEYNTSTYKSSMGESYFKYFTQFVPFMYETVGLLNQTQVTIPFMASGIAPTFHFNSELMCLPANDILSTDTGLKDYDPEGLLTFLDAKRVGDTIAYVPQKQDLPGYLNKFFNDYKIKIKAELVLQTDNARRDFAKPGLLKMDLLGFDLYNLYLGDNLYRFSVLSRDRLMGAIFYIKSVSRSSKNRDIINQFPLLVDLLRFVTYKNLFMMGGFAYDDISMLLQYAILTDGAGYITLEREYKKIVDQDATILKRMIREVLEVAGVEKETIAIFQDVDLSPNIPSLEKIAAINLPPDQVDYFRKDLVAAYKDIGAEVAELEETFPKNTIERTLMNAVLRFKKPAFVSIEPLEQAEISSVPKKEMTLAPFLSEKHKTKNETPNFAPKFIKVYNFLKEDFTKKEGGKFKKTAMTVPVLGASLSHIRWDTDSPTFSIASVKMDDLVKVIKYRFYDYISTKLIEEYKAEAIRDGKEFTKDDTRLIRSETSDLLRRTGQDALADSIAKRVQRRELSIIFKENPAKKFGGKTDEMKKEEMEEV